MASPTLRVPEKDLPSFILLRDMPDDALDAFVREVSRTPAAPLAAIPSVSPDDAQQLRRTLRSLYEMRAYFDLPLEELIRELSRALRESKKLVPEAEGRFQERLRRALNIGALGTVAKATSLQHESERDFCSARILTDARPVYGESVTDAPSAIIIMHTLKISYHKSPEGQLSDVYFGLDSKDLVLLRDVVGRAEAKAKSLRSALEGANLKVIDPQV